MHQSSSKNVCTLEKTQIESVKVGKIVKIEKNGKVLVDYPGNNLGTVTARLTSSVKIEYLRNNIDSNPTVLLVFENNDPQLPIIIDTLYSPIDDILAAPSTFNVEKVGKPEGVIVDGKKVVFEGKEEIVLRCGKGSITLKKDGKIVIRGTNVISRATQINKIKGSAVKIN